MTRQTEILAGLLLISVPGVQFGGYSLLRLVTRREHGWEDNQLRRSLWRAGHAHAGVWIILALVVLLYVDQVLSGTAATIARFAVVLAPSSGHWVLSVSDQTDAEKPNGAITWLPRGGAPCIGVIIPASPC